jgi:hypothetical protein
VKPNKHIAVMLSLLLLFGLFIHWGVYAVPAGYYHGKPRPTVGEWVMCRANG